MVGRMAGIVLAKCLRRVHRELMKVLVNHLDSSRECVHRWCRVRNHWFNICDPAA